MRRALMVGEVALLLAVVGIAGARAGDGAKAADGQAAVSVAYRNGLRFTTGDGVFSLRLQAGVQFRYDYVAYDHAIKGNDANYSNFYLRRARLWLDGNALDPRLTFLLHLQLEPQAAVNVHEAWVQYAFSDLFRVRAGRDKVPYGVEFLASSFGLNFIDRPILNGETDINAGGGRSKWPGGGTDNFATSAENANTGFPVGGLCLYRSQGVALSGTQTFHGGALLSYDLGVWNGRDSRGLSNPDTGMLYTGRLSFLPLGPVDLQTQGDLAFSELPRLAVVGSLYSDTSSHNRDAAGTAVPFYDTHDHGHNLALVFRYRGASLEAEWGTESYEMVRHLPGEWTFDRDGWRAAVGYFVKPKRIEIVGRVSQVQRLEDPTPAKVTNSGLGFVQVWNGSSYATTMEKTLTEATLGLNFYFGTGHQHKLFFDGSRLGRSFAPYQGFAPADQRDTRFRTMLQFRI